MHAAGTNRRTQHHGRRSLAHRASAAELYAGHRDVQHVRPARDVGAAGLEHGRPAARHDVRGPVWRRSHIISSCCTTRAGPALEGPAASGLRIASSVFERSGHRSALRKRVKSKENDKTQPQSTPQLTMFGEASRVRSPASFAILEDVYFDPN